MAYTCTAKAYGHLMMVYVDEVVRSISTPFWVGCFM